LVVQGDVGGPCFRGFATVVMLYSGPRTPRPLFVARPLSKVERDRSGRLLAYRDHTWGRHEWSTLLAHRYLAGTVGPELTFCTLGWLGIDGRLAHFGLLVRDGVFKYAESVDFLTYLEADGTSHRGGEVMFHMPDGEAVTLRPRLVDSVLHEHGGEGGAALSAVDSICIVEYDGMRGFGNLEITNNAKNGADPVRAVNRAAADNGLSRRPWNIADGSVLE
jgi:hypothetical protein